MSRLGMDFDEIPVDATQGLRGRAVLVTGATGSIGSTLVKYLLHLNVAHGYGMTVYCLVRSRERASAILGNGDYHLVVSTVQELDIGMLPGPVDYIFHAAAETRSLAMVQEPAELVSDGVHGMLRVLGLARNLGCRLIYLSSMEAYGVVAGSEPRVEDQLGRVDLASARSSYPVTKRVCEFLCTAFVEEYGVDAVIARLAHTAGAGSRPDDSRAFMSFVRSASAGEDVVIRSSGRGMMNFVYMSDALTGLLLIATRGNRGTTYNVANEDCRMSVLEMARTLVGTAGDGRSQVRVEVDPDNRAGYGAETQLNISSQALRELGWRPRADMGEAGRRSAAYFSEQASKEDER